MINAELIRDLVNTKFEGTEKYLVDISITPDNRIYIYIDSDKHLTINDCVEVNRYLISNLDKDKEDFELLVSSAGLDKGFTLKRQYLKNIGNEVEVVLKSGEKKYGKLLNADDNVIELEVLAESAKKAKNKNVNTEKIVLSFDDIKETKAVISFKK